MTQSIYRLDALRTAFIGLDTTYPLADGRVTRRVYLDSTASTLMFRPAHDALEAYYRHYANTHSRLHFSAKISTDLYHWAHEKVLQFLHADPEEYACFFTGSGATAGMNRMARVFRDFRPDRDTVLVSLMEHHSNDLPHRKHAGRVIHLPLKEHSGQPGCIDLAALEAVLSRERDRINYVAVTGVSNVTGIINPIYDVAELAHRYGALVLVDGAQMVAHLPVWISHPDQPERNLDAFVFSGHKTYVPGSPGVVVCRKDILSAIEPEEVGGGMVERVFVDRYIITSQFPDREEAGTPNIPGAIALATTLDILDRVGMDTLFQEESRLIHYALERFQSLPTVMVYGETDPRICPRAASISFNIYDVDHGLTAAILNDYHNIAVRNECFCAHPYVEEMIRDDIPPDLRREENILSIRAKLKSGMVRASFGLYNTEEDVERLMTALRDISDHIKDYRTLYTVDAEGNYVHRTFRPPLGEIFSLQSLVEAPFV
ncbi:MAG: aminotransferase class V-fold PLP-dependent enzyme [Candidatus Neomarinimicrobiota bacterium]|nr:MAG: aminotransferase class V-fold PLP-dependent enzyme [Candidatus Neomarinimicrobiota bacterium]